MVASHETRQTLGSIEIIGVYHGDIHGRSELDPVLIQLEDADCVLIENVGGTHQQRNQMTEFYNAVSQGLIEPERLDHIIAGSSAYILHLVAGLYDSNKLILPIDTAEDAGDPIWMALQKEHELRHQLQDESLDGVQTMKLVRELRNLQTLTLWHRDARMAEQIVNIEDQLEVTFGEPQTIKVVVGNDHVEGIQQALVTLRDEYAA